VRGWEKHLPGRIWGAWPPQTWVRRWQRLGQELLVRLWRHVEDNSPATRSRGPWTWVGDDRLVRKYGQQLGLVGTWWSGQEHRGRCGIHGLLRLVGIGDGKLVVPVDFVVRRPAPQGPGRPCRDTLPWLQVMLDRTGRARRRRCRQWPAPLVVADSGFGDSKVRAQGATALQGTLLVEGKRRGVFQLPDGRRVTGHDLRVRDAGPWRDSPPAPGLRDARLTAAHPTYGAVTRVLVDKAGQDRFYLLGRETSISAPRLIRAWRRRSWVEHRFRPLKHLLATEACQVQGEDAYYGHLVLRLVAGMVLLSTAHVICKAQVTMAELLFSLKHSWRFLDSERVE
jgi:hypothetical protein